MPSVDNGFGQKKVQWARIMGSWRGFPLTIRICAYQRFV